MSKIKSSENEATLPSVRSSKRDVSLDYIRGIAGILMVLAHSIHFFHTGTDETLRFWEGVGNTLCFTTFLFVSGAVTTLAYLKEGTDWKKKRSNLLKRLLYLITGYYLIAFVVSLNSFTAKDWVNQAFDLIVFKNVPGFTEFIIPFIFLTISTLFLRKLYKLISKRFSFALIAGIIAFFIGSVLFTIYVPYPYDQWKAIFVGSEGVYRFPLLQYFPIFSLGLWWGNNLRKKEADTKHEVKSFYLGLFAVGIFLLTSMVSRKFSIPFINPLDRWPPSIGFLSIGVAFIAFTRIIIKNLEKVKFLDPINRFFIYIGQDAFDMFLFSTLILFIYQQVWGQKYDSWQITLVLTGVLIALTLLASSLNSFNSPSLFHKGTDIFKPYQRLFKKRYLVLSIVMVIIVFGNLRIPVYSDVAGTIVSIEDLKGVQPLEEGKVLPWWNNEFGNFSQIEIETKQGFTSLRSGDTVKLNFNHKEFVDLNESGAEGQDLQLVYLNEEDEYQTLTTNIINPNQTNSQLLFNVVNKLYPSQKDNRYFLYYEEILLDSERQLFDNLIAINHQDLITTDPISEYSISFVKNISHPITTDVSSIWEVRGITDPKNFTFNAKINDPKIVDEGLKYRITGTDIKGPMIQAYPLNYLAEVQTKYLSPGAYEIVAYTDYDNKEVISQSSYFLVTEPIYVSWTLDWEGYNENPTYLEQLTNFSEKHNLPLTHFFNPRIYIAEEISQEQRNYMTNWVLNRKEEFGDSIGLHLHMHKDMVEAAGIEPKDEPRWGRYKDADGQDVPTTAYSYDEIEKIISWGVNQMEEQNLGTPKMYRAGGWFANLDVLNVLAEKDFWLDSSGRKKEAWWNFEYWNLDNTTQPYQVSELNQNSSKEPTIGLWEFPNNGLDTTAFEAADSIQKFTENYPGGILEEKKLVTYLSHPRWFGIDGPRMETVLEYLENFKYENDKGPVIFITLEEAYEIWTE